MLESVPPGVTTCTGPLVAPAGTLVVIEELETTLKMAAVPLNVTLLAPVRFVPRMVTGAPTRPEAETVFTNGARPAERLKIVPQPSRQAELVPP